MPTPCRHCGIPIAFRGVTGAPAHHTQATYAKFVGVDVSPTMVIADEFECNADTAGLSDMVGQRYYGYCCNCLLRMGIPREIYVSPACCNGCRMRWDSLPDHSTIAKPSSCAGNVQCHVM